MSFHEHFEHDSPLLVHVELCARCQGHAQLQCGALVEVGEDLWRTASPRGLGTIALPPPKTAASPLMSSYRFTMVEFLHSCFDACL